MSFCTGRTIRYFPILATLVMGLSSCSPSPKELLAHAATLQKADQLDAACRIYQTVLDRNPYDVVAVQGMVDCTRNSLDPSEHQIWCRKLLQFRPWDRHANLIIGKSSLDEGNLKDAVVRFYLAYMESDFAQDKKDVLALLEQVRAQEKQRNNSKEAFSDENAKPPIISP